MYNLFDAFQRGVDECKKKRSKDLQNKRRPSTLLRLNNLRFHLFFIDIVHHPISHKQSKGEFLSTISEFSKSTNYPRAELRALITG